MLPAEARNRSCYRSCYLLYHL